MNMTDTERKALQAIRTPANVYSKEVEATIRSLERKGFCETCAPLAWQRESEGCPICIAVITASGRRALKEVTHAIA